MWNPIKIEINNLFAHKHSEYKFKNNACTVIFGENRTDKGMDNNGAGKTTLFEAVCIALTNESLRNIKKDSFINREADCCSVDMELYNPAMRMKLRIFREFYRSGKPVKVEVWENDELNTQIVSVNEANRRVLELIGVSREDLLRYFIISQDNSYTFFTASDTEKKEIMNRITSADMINPVIEELSVRFGEKQAVYNRLEGEVERLSERKETLAEQRQELLDSDDTDERVAELEEKIRDVENHSVENSEKVSEYNNKISAIDKETAETAVPDVSALKTKRKQLINEVDKLENELTENKRIKRNLQAELSDTIECPKCGHEFIHKSELGLTVYDAKRLLKEIEIEIEKSEKKINQKSAESSKLKDDIESGEAVQEHLDDLAQSRRNYERKIESLKSENAEIQKKVERWKNDIKELKNKKNNDVALKSLTEKIEVCDREMLAKRKEMEPVESELDMIKFWQFNMGKSGFMTYLANRSVKIIEGITNSYLRKFGVDVSVVINGFKVLKSGEVREKIDVFVSNDGITAESFMSKSGGERGRVMLAGVLGIQHLINLSTNGRGLNLLIFDECFHGMDSMGQENIIKIFEQMGITILVITQNVSESFNNENTLYVVKENGVSRYISAPQS